MNRKQRTGSLLTGIALLGLSVLGARVLAGGPTAGARVVTSTGVATAGAPGADTTTVWLAAEGRVVTRAGGEVLVSVERSGRLVRLLVDESARVERGALLAEIDDEELRAALAEVRARLKETDADLALAERTLARRRDLVERRVAAPQELDVAERDANAARARRAALEAESTRLGVQIARCRVMAPISGTVSQRHADAGEVLEAGDPVLTLVDMDHLRISGEADESDAGRISPGARVRITADGWPGLTWSGVVEDVPGWVGPRSLKPVDPARPSDTRVLGFKVALTERSPLKVGTTVELRVAAPVQGVDAPR